MQSGSVTILGEYAQAVDSSRNTFFEGLQDMPFGIREVVKSNYNNRLNRSSGKPMLGEYAPWLLADLLPLRSRDSITRVSGPWMNLYAYTLFIDDLLDVDHKPDAAPLLLASGLILQRGLTELLAVLPPGTAVRVQLDKHFLQAAQAVHEEVLNHRRHLQEFAPEEVDKLGEKVAFLRLCASCLLLADGDLEIKDELLVPIEDLATGMQILDDVTDWEEDWRSGHYTPLLTQTLIRAQESGVERASAPEHFTAQELLTAMIGTGSLKEMLNKASERLHRIRSCAAKTPGSVGHGLICSLVEEIDTFRDEVAQVETLCVRRRKFWSGRPDWIEKVANDSSVKNRTKFIADRIKIVAQNT